VVSVYRQHIVGGVGRCSGCLPRRFRIRGVSGVSVFSLSFFFLLTASVVLAAGSTFFVAPNGDDNAWHGTQAEPGDADGPFATLTRARDEIRRLCRAGKLVVPVTVYVRGGRYELKQTFMLTEDDSGTPSAPIVYRAYADEKPVLSGGRRIDTEWTGTSGGIMACDLKDLGLAEVWGRDLYFNGQRQQLARRPNFEPERPCAGGFNYVAGDAIPMHENVPDEARDILRFQDGDIGEWARPEAAEVVVFPRFNWSNDIVRIAAIDAAAGTIKLVKNASYAIRPGDRYYVQNVLEELDCSGEWYLDVANARLHFWAPSNLAFGDVVVPRLKKLVVFANARHVTFHGFTLEAAKVSAIFVVNGNNCRISGNIVRNIGGRGGGAIVVGGTDCVVAGNDVYDVGAAGIVIRGGDRSTLEAGGNVAENNHVSHVGQHQKQAAGIICSGVGNRVAHNLIHDCPRAGIVFRGNEHVIENNHVRHVCLETANTAAIYTFAAHDISRRGHVVRYNLIHDVLGFGRFEGKWVSPYYAWGIYLDGGASGVKVTGNVCARMPWGGGMILGGYDNIWESNIFIDGGFKQMTVSCWSEADAVVKPQAEALLRSRERKSGNPFYKERYPEMFEDKKGETGNKFLRNIISYREPYSRLYDFHYVGADFECDYNLVYHYAYPIITGLNEHLAEKQWEVWQEAGMDVHSQLGDPLFGDGPDDYTLKPESPALALGFQPILLDEIGPYESDTRASWPVQELDGVREQPIKADLLASPKPPVPAVPVGNAIEEKGVPTCVATWRQGAIALDGFLDAGEWPDRMITLRQTVERREILGAPVTMRLVHDGSRLYVAMEVPVPDVARLRTGGMWGTNDGFEISFQGKDDEDAPIYVVKCYAGGKCQSTTTAGASPEQASALQDGLEYAVEIGTEGWSAELCLPLKMIGHVPQEGAELAFNVGVRRVQTREWILWVGTKGESWAVEDAGVLRISMEKDSP